MGMQQSLDLKELEARFDQVRKSEYFPAILGALAGGLTGALMAGLISAGRGGGNHEAEQESSGKQGVILGFSAKDLLQLATVTAGLAKQLRDWQNQNNQ